MNRSIYWLAALGLGLISAASAAPYARGHVASVDVGPAAAFAENAQVTVTVSLNLRNTDELEALVKSVYTPGTMQFRQFLTTDQFRDRFGPTADTIAAVTKSFESQGLSVTRSATAQLHVTGTTAAIENAFGVKLHAYEVAATSAAPGYRFRAPLSAPHAPTEIASSVRAVLGLETRPQLMPHMRESIKAIPMHGSGPPNTTDPPGQWTTVDFGEYYDIGPLYNRGITGQGHTLAVITLAGFTQSDAYTYWNAIGLTVNPNRITEIPVDGGSGPPSDAAGSSETTLDVEQAGGIAPGADILVYEAPNTNQAYVDAFAAAIDSNWADTIATSWGEWEVFNSLNPCCTSGTVNDPTNGQQTSVLQAQNDLLIQAALQGQSVFAAAGDSGAYDLWDELPQGSFNPVLSVDSPGSQRFITTGGGTTLAGTQTYTDANGNIVFQVTIPHEQAWSWTYLDGLCPALGGGPDCLFATGTGGGVSVTQPRPFYQRFTPGMQNSVAGQTLYQLPESPANLVVALPAGYAGRNVPDISLNADPQTGYLVLYTSSVNGLEVLTAGGTSFVGQQLQGVVTLYNQALHRRVGFLNPALYYIADSWGAYGGFHAPLRDITKGNNWYWNAHHGYDQATGLGVPDATNLLEALKELGYGDD